VKVARRERLIVAESSLEKSALSLFGSDCIKTGLYLWN
jgi:hypothetical protein